MQETYSDVNSSKSTQPKPSSGLTVNCRFVEGAGSEPKCKLNFRCCKDAFFFFKATTENFFFKNCAAFEKLTPDPINFPFVRNLKTRPWCYPFIFQPELPFVSNDYFCLLFYFSCLLKSTTVTSPCLNHDIAARLLGETATRPQRRKLRRRLLLRSLYISYLWCVCSRLHFKSKIIPPPSASCRPARGQIHKSKRINRPGERVLPPSPLRKEKKRKTWRPWGLSINREQSQWPFCLC